MPHAQMSMDAPTPDYPRRRKGTTQCCAVCQRFGLKTAVLLPALVRG